MTSTLVALCPGRETLRFSNAPDVVVVADPIGGPSCRGRDGAALAVFMDINFYDALGAQPGATNAELRRDWVFFGVRRFFSASKATPKKYRNIDIFGFFRRRDAEKEPPDAEKKPKNGYKSEETLGLKRGV